MTSSGAQNLSVVPGSNGSSNGTTIASDSISVTTTCPAGYNLSMSASVNDNKLYLGGSNSSSSYFSPANGTTALSNATNTWGYYSNGSTVPTGSTAFSAVPAFGSTATIKNSSNTSDSFNVYYGVSVSNGLTPGTYKMKPDANNNNSDGSIIYYLTMDDSCMSPSMQEMTTSDCTTTATTVEDSRDGETYLVQKLADGNCWMLDNLRLGGSSTIDLTPSDTNIASNWTLPASSTANFTTSTGYTTAAINADSKNTTVTSYGSGSGKVGNYYNYCAASAGTYCYASNNSTGDAEHDICPAGWRMPTLVDYDNLYINGYSSNVTNFVNALSTPLSGSFYDTGSAHDQGFSGTFWASTRYDGDGMRILSVYAGSVYTNVQNSRYTGNSMRCIQMPQFTIHFDANGGSGSMPDQVGYVGGSLQLNANAFTNTEGTMFYGWSTSPDSNDESPWFPNKLTIPAEATSDIPAGETITLYAMWGPIDLYAAVESMSKGTQTAADLQAPITKENSGVYEYDAETFGEINDTYTANFYTVYYYRGILDDTLGSYGSNGDGAAYPNYVILSNTGTKSTNDTCWRIIRTTSDHGVKMIYNGKWTGSTCANATTAAQINSPVTASTFNGTANSSNIARQIVRVGYTHNSTYANTSSTSSVAFDTVFGNDNTDSTIKSNVESWYNSNLSNFYYNINMDGSFCNDRYSYTTSTGSTATTSIRPYTTSTNTGATYVAYFAPYQRNATTAQSPSLSCNNRNQYDRYTANNDGNELLNYPVGLISADEASFAGTGSNTATNGSSYSANSFLNSGSNYWTISPYNRVSGYAYNFYVNSNGYLQNGRIDTAYGVRPVITLMNYSHVKGGTGTATNPWIVKPYTSMQSASFADCGEPMYDSRDGTVYGTNVVNGQCWMSDDLAISGTLSAADSNFTGSDFQLNCVSGYISATNSSAQCKLANSTGTSIWSSNGNWYNYYAATAGTISGSSNRTTATKDICPSGWRLPSQSEAAGIDNTSGFVPTWGGLYDSSSHYNSQNGYWWTSAAANDLVRYTIDATTNENTLSFNPSKYSYFSNAEDRKRAIHIRCVKN